LEGQAGERVVTETYIGDGVYASFDGYQIWLRTTRDGIHDERIALEPQTFNALIRFADEHWSRRDT
jgi:hypothetical protein